MDERLMCVCVCVQKCFHISHRGWQALGVVSSSIVVIAPLCSKLLGRRDIVVKGASGRPFCSQIPQRFPDKIHLLTSWALCVGLLAFPWLLLFSVG